MTLKQQIQDVYEQSYKEALANAEPNAVKITITAGRSSKDYVEPNFYMCGFNNIKFKAVGKNRELLSLGGRKRRAYPSGFYLDIDEIGYRGNGDFYIQKDAYQAVERFLESLGYDVSAESRLD